MNVKAFLQKDYENETAYRPKKTNPNKPNLVRRRRIANELKIACRKIRPKFLVVGAYAMGAYSLIISVYNLIIFHS